MNSHLAIDVFTPASPAKLTFVPRTSINDKLFHALRTPGKQIVVYGHSGCGKTTLLLRKLEQVYVGQIVTSCVASMTFEAAVLAAFDSLAPVYVAGRSVERTSSVDGGIQAEYLGLRATLGESVSTREAVDSHRVLPPQLTPQALGRFLGGAQLCWVLEDFHKLPDVERQKLAQYMKVFMDLGAEYPTLKIVAVGAVDTARLVVQCEPEMRNRVAEILVPLMTEPELRLIVETGAGLLNISIPRHLIAAVVQYANGLPSVCHQLCLNLCHALDIEKTAKVQVPVKEGELTHAIQEYLDEASDTLKSRFDAALKRKRRRKFDNTRIIVEALCDVDQEGAPYADLYQAIRKRHPTYPSGNLGTYLLELQSAERGGLIRLDQASGRYSFGEPAFRSFALAALGKVKISNTSRPPGPAGKQLDMRQYLEVINQDGGLLQLAQVVLESLVDTSGANKRRG